MKTLAEIYRAGQPTGDREIDEVTEPAASAGVNNVTVPFLSKMVQHSAPHTPEKLDYHNEATTMMTIFLYNRIFRTAR